MKRILCNMIYPILCLALTVPAFSAPRRMPADRLNEMERSFKPLDISKAANMGFVDTIPGDGIGGWTDQGAANDMREFELVGTNRLAGVDFNIIDPQKNDGKSCIVLRGQDIEAFPTSVEIPVNSKGRGVYFLSNGAWINPDMGRYRFIYEDGSEAAVNIRGNIDVFNRWGARESETSVTAWTGSNLILIQV